MPLTIECGQKRWWRGKNGDKPRQDSVINSHISTNWYQRIQQTAHLTERSNGAKKEPILKKRGMWLLHSLAENSLIDCCVILSLSVWVAGVPWPWAFPLRGGGGCRLQRGPVHFLRVSARLPANGTFHPHLWARDNPQLGSSFPSLRR